MGKVRLEIKNMLQNSIEKPTLKKEEINYEIDSIIKLDLIKELTDDNEIKEILISKTKTLVNLQIKNALALGEIFTSVFSEISKKGSTYDGLYEKWLQINGINKRTALRYRKRYELYSAVKNKEFVAIMPQKYIDLISSQENNSNYIELIDSSSNYEEISKVLESKEILPQKIDYKENISFNFEIYNKLFVDLDKKIVNLKDKDRKELQKYL
ncbi:hypothetical protein, partial [Cetobacterium sp.]|uniref:hypothetical protein n=1 Tax=Cetobacterium sp. TaxID=2071632 RepID=UPI003F373C66